MMLKFLFASLHVFLLSLPVFCHRIVRSRAGEVLKGAILEGDSPAGGLENTTNLDLQPSGGPIASDAVYFNFNAEGEDVALPPQVWFMHHKGYTAAMQDWTHIRWYAKGLVSEHATANVEVSGLDPTAEYNFVVYQYEYGNEGRPALGLLPFCKVDDDNLHLENPEESARTYSSIHDNDKLGTGHARSMLDSPQAWSARSNTVGQWMQMDLGRSVGVAGVIIQGRSSTQWVKAYEVYYSQNNRDFKKIDDWFHYLPTDRTTKVTNLFGEPVQARYIRISVQDWIGHISMRAAAVVEVCTQYPITEKNYLEVEGREVFSEQWNDNFQPTAEGVATSSGSGSIKFTFTRRVPNKEIHISGLRLWPALACQSQGVLPNHYMKSAQQHKRGAERWGESWTFKTDAGGQFKCPGLAIYGMGKDWAPVLEQHNNDGLKCQKSSTGFDRDPYRSGGFPSPLCCWCLELHCLEPNVLTFDRDATPRFQCRKMTVYGRWKELWVVRPGSNPVNLLVGYNASLTTKTVVNFKESAQKVVKRGFFDENNSSRQVPGYIAEQVFRESVDQFALGPNSIHTVTLNREDGKRLWQWEWRFRTDQIGENLARCMTVQMKKKPQCNPGFGGWKRKRSDYSEGSCQSWE